MKGQEKENANGERAKYRHSGKEITKEQEERGAERSRGQQDIHTTQKRNQIDKDKNTAAEKKTLRTNTTRRCRKIRRTEREGGRHIPSKIQTQRTRLKKSTRRDKVNGQEKEKTNTERSRYGHRGKETKTEQEDRGTLGGHLW